MPNGLFDEPLLPSIAERMAESSQANTDPLAVPFGTQGTQGTLAPPVADPGTQAPAQAQAAQAQTQTTQPSQRQHMIQKLLDDLVAERAAGKSKGKWGVDILDKTVGEMGISPAKAALFALSALVTRKMPTQQAWQTAQTIMNIPEVWAQHKQQSADQMVSRLVQLVQAGGLEETRTAQTDLRRQQLQQRQVEQSLQQQMLQKFNLLPGGAQPGITAPVATTQPTAQTTAQPTLAEAMTNVGVSPEVLAELGGPQLVQALGAGQQPVQTQQGTYMVGDFEYEIVNDPKARLGFSIKSLGRRMTLEGLLSIYGDKLSEAQAAALAQLPPSLQSKALDRVLKTEKPSEASLERDIWARGMHGKPFDKLSDKQKQEVELKRKTAGSLVIKEAHGPEKRLSRVDAPLIVDNKGRSVPPHKVIGKTIDQIPEAAAVLTPHELGSLRAAQRVVRIGEELKALAPKILKTYRGTNLKQIFAVTGNQLYLTQAASRAGDPNVIKFQALLNGFLISEPQALGIPGGRESVRLLEMVAKGAPTLGSTVEGLNAAIDTSIDADIAPAWDARGINIRASEVPSIPSKTPSKAPPLPFEGARRIP